MAHFWVHFPCLFFTLFSHILVTNSFMPGVQRRFEYKLSFKGPHLVQRDGTVPFWEHGGHAIASDESIRITPSLRSKKGFVWGRNKNTHEHWEVEVSFRVNGRGRIGADGLALWFTEVKGEEGPVFGSNDKWKGLGILFDSFDNDGQHNNPYVLVMVNDGTMMYDHQTDGQHQQLGGCLRDFRNKPFPVRARVEYYQKSLTLYIHNGMTNNKEDFELCMRAENVELPREGYFGVSAATGGLADDHDVTSFLTHSLTPTTDQKTGQDVVPDEERQKFEKEFDDYQQKLQKAKEDYQKEHPDRRPADYEEDEKYFESQDVKELKMIFDGQNAIHNTMRILHQRLDEIVGRQERTLSQITMIQSGAAGGGQAQPHQGQPAQQLPMDTIKRFEVDTIINTQRELQSSLKSIQNLISDINSRAKNTQTGGGGSVYDGTQHYNDIKNAVNSLHQDVRSINSKPPPAPLCPEPPATNCVTTFYLFFFLAIQIFIFLGYSMYRNSKEAAAKKFY